jgi:hypothetical protein
MTPLIRLQPRHIEYADGVGLVRRGKAMMRAARHTNNWRPNFEKALLEEPAVLALRAGGQAVAQSDQLEHDRREGDGACRLGRFY